MGREVGGAPSGADGARYKPMARTKKLAISARVSGRSGQNSAGSSTLQPLVIPAAFSRLMDASNGLPASSVK